MLCKNYCIVMSPYSSFSSINAITWMEMILSRKLIKFWNKEPHLVSWLWFIIPTSNSANTWSLDIPKVLVCFLHPMTNVKQKSMALCRLVKYCFMKTIVVCKTAQNNSFQYNVCPTTGWSFHNWSWRKICSLICKHANDNIFSFMILYLFACLTST